MESPPPSESSFRDKQSHQLPEGIYVLRNKMARTVLDLWSNDEGTLCHGYSLVSNVCIGHQRWHLQRATSNETYTLKNIQYSKYLEVSEGSNKNGTKVIPRPRNLADNDQLSQEWRIEERARGERTLQCARTNTFLEIIGGDPSDGTEVTCSEAAVERDHQLWILERVSRTASEIKAMLEGWKPNLSTRIIQTHADHIEYFVLPHELRNSLWVGTNIHRQPVLQGLFGDNDFVIQSKHTMTSWARDKYPVQAEGISVLFGIVYGEAAMGPKAYNCYLTPDMCSLVFFDAQIGREYSPAAMEGFGFEPTFVIF